MIKWFVNKDNQDLSNFPKAIINHKVGVYNFSIVTNPDLMLYNESIHEGLFIYGYIMPRISFSVKENIQQVILDGFKKNGPEFLNNFKGNFQIIIFYEGKLFLLNDHFGISKFFYTTSNTCGYLASNHISFLTQNCRPSLSIANIIKYYAFNYFINGSTIYNEIKYSAGSCLHEISEIKGLTEKTYFSINDFIDSRKVCYSKSESIQKASELWKEIIQQYLSFFHDKKISQTLTAGMDSRLILAGFRSNNYFPSTFTFGRKDSMDVIHAKKIAKKLKLKHSHHYPNEEFFKNYKDKVPEVIDKTSGMASLYRAHRFDAYKSLKTDYDILFFGFIGSETIRGLYPDGLTVPKIVSDFWLNGDFQLKDYYPNEWFAITDEEIASIEQEIKQLDFINRPDVFLFKMMIPLHFGQDIALNEELNVLSVAPFWDIDFLDFQRNTEFFTDSNRKEDFATLGHYKRRKGPYFSANLIHNLDKTNAKLSLGKGYSPSDYKFSLYYASLKFVFYKILYRKQYEIPNFNYGSWFKDYLTVYLKSNKFNFLAASPELLVNDIIKNTGEGELEFIDFVKIINIHLISKL